MVATNLITLGAALALAVPATAIAPTGAEYRALRARDYQYLDLVPLEQRQETSPEKFQCHSDCGTTITDARKDGYCDSDEWLGLLDACLECVVEHPIWQNYGDSVKAAAAGCGLSAEPGEDATPTGASDGNSSETTTQPPTPAETSGSTEEEATPTPSGSAAGAEGTDAPGGAARISGSVFAAGVLALAAAFFL